MVPFVDADWDREGRQARGGTDMKGKKETARFGLLGKYSRKGTSRGTPGSAMKFGLYVTTQFFRNEEDTHLLS